MPQPEPEFWPGSKRFNDAIQFASWVHKGQLRKKTSIPYFSHVLAVCAIVIEDCGTEDEAIAALLHDAVEDGEGKKTLAEIRQQFGDAVADMVWDCSDTDIKPKPPWDERKARYIEHVRKAGVGARRVSCADKLHNARSILFDYRTHSDALWTRFSVGRDKQLWYYRALVQAFREAGGGPMVDELDRVVEQIARESDRG